MDKNSNKNVPKSGIDGLKNNYAFENKKAINRRANDILGLTNVDKISDEELYKEFGFSETDIVSIEENIEKHRRDENKLNEKTNVSNEQDKYDSKLGKPEGNLNTETINNPNEYKDYLYEMLEQSKSSSEQAKEFDLKRNKRSLSMFGLFGHIGNKITNWLKNPSNKTKDDFDVINDLKNDISRAETNTDKQKSLNKKPYRKEIVNKKIDLAIQNLNDNANLNIEISRKRNLLRVVNKRLRQTNASSRTKDALNKKKGSLEKEIVELENKKQTKNQVLSGDQVEMKSLIKTYNSETRAAKPKSEVQTENKNQAK